MFIKYSIGRVNNNIFGGLLNKSSNQTKLQQPYITIILKTNQMLAPTRSSPQRRASSTHVISQLTKVTQVIDLYTKKQFLQQYSLYAHLFSSQAYTFTMQEPELMNLWFGRETLQVGELYEYSYFQRRDKKMLLFMLIMRFLRNEGDGGKAKIVVLENVEKVNQNELKAFLVDKQYGGNEKLLKQLQKRVIFMFSKSQTYFKFNLSMVTLMQQSDQFIKCAIISDVNSFQTSDKLTQEKYYKRLSKKLLVFSFRRDIYDYKVIQKSPINHFYAQQHGQDKYQLNDKVTSVLKKKYEMFRVATIAFLIPIEYLGLSTKNIEETYKSCLIRLLPNANGYLEFIFKGSPFTVENVRQITMGA